MKTLAIGLLATISISLVTNAEANDRYRTRPPVVISPDLSAPWVLQLNNPRNQQRILQQRSKKTYVIKRGDLRTSVQRSGVQQAYVRVQPTKKKATKPSIDPQFLPRMVDYDSEAKVGSIVIDTNSKFLYLMLGDGKARRYGVGVGKPGFEWSGTHKVSRKSEWPSWRPPAEMIAREKKKGRDLPTYMEGGPQNPLGARALYLGSTLYRIHGTNQPWTIGQAVSSGCIRMRNQDVVDLYERVKVGARVQVI